jgi:hypothetical protein
VIKALEYKLFGTGIFPVSTTLESEYGITDVSLSISCRIGADRFRNQTRSIKALGTKLLEAFIFNHDRQEINSS